MIESIKFKNFKVLRDAILPLDRFTLIVGPNGSGKSTALQAILAAGNPGDFDFQQIVSAELRHVLTATVNVTITFGPPAFHPLEISWARNKASSKKLYAHEIEADFEKLMEEELAKTRIYSFDARAISQPTRLQPNIELMSDGENLAGVLDQLRDHDTERFEALNEELTHWLPEYDRILFETPRDGAKAFLLRTKEGKHKIAAADLSQGTLLALALLTLAYLPEPPKLICLEEPDRGIHPRLLRNVQDALYRLSYPESGGELRLPVQVIATTHSPYLLDLYRDHPEEIVLANKTEESVSFERLSEQPFIDEILRDSRLGEMWYTGILGGVPLHS
jgi:predicted ATPase